MTSFERLKKIFPCTIKFPPLKKTVSEWTEGSKPTVTEMKRCSHRKVKAEEARSLPLTVTAPDRDSSGPCQLGAGGEAWQVFLARPVITGEEGRPHACAEPFRAVLWSLRKCLRGTKGRNITSVASVCEQARIKNVISFEFLFSIKFM